MKGWHYWVLLALVFFGGAFLGSKVPSLNVFKSLAGKLGL
jgi:hypothetical protein